MMNVPVFHGHEAETACEALVAWMSCDRCVKDIDVAILDNLTGVEGPSDALRATEPGQNGPGGPRDPGEA